MILYLTIDESFDCERFSTNANASTNVVVSAYTEDPKKIGSIFYIRLK